MNVAAKVFKDERAAVLASKKTNVWEIPPGLDAMQLFSRLYSALHRKDDGGLLTARAVPPPLLKQLVPGMAETALIGGIESFYEERVRPTWDVV